MSFAIIFGVSLALFFVSEIRKGYGPISALFWACIKGGGITLAFAVLYVLITDIPT